MAVVVGVGILGLITAGIMDTFGESIKLQQAVLTKQSIQTQQMAAVELLSRRETCQVNFQGLDVGGFPRAPNGNRLLAITAAGTPPTTAPAYTVNDTYENGRFTLTAMTIRNWRPRAAAGPDSFKGSMELVMNFQPTQGIAVARIIPIAVELNGLTVGAANPTQIATCVSVGNDSNQPWTLTAAGDIAFMGGNVGIDIINPTQRLQVNGFVLATGYLHPSDRRLKEDIHPAPGLVAIEKINGVRFRWKDSGLRSNGVIAQEVEEVLPEAVNTDRNGEKSVNYEALIGPLIESTKELAENNRRLEEILKAQQREIEELRK